MKLKGCFLQVFLPLTQEDDSLNVALKKKKPCELICLNSEVELFIYENMCNFLVP